MKKNIIFGMLVSLAVLFTACNQTDYDPIPTDDLIGDSLTTTYTIAQLKADFMKNTDFYSDTNIPSDLYTANLIDTTADVVISGYITSSDVEGTFYKNFVVQETFQGGQAIKFSIDGSGLSGIYPIGQQVWIRCNGLHIGNYGQAPQLGTKYVNTTRQKTNTAGATVYRTEPGRLNLILAKSQINAYGMPNNSIIKADTMTIAQINTAKYDTLVNRLICIKNAYFTGFDGNSKPLSGENLIFAPTTNGVGYPQLRMINDGTGNIAIATSEYAKFASKQLPTSNYKGNITVIVGWYKNYVDATGVWQLNMRTLGDLGKGFEEYLNEVGYTK
ncbi:MAG: DUF5689 domain-containing protein [Paludibacteraceae bacterium]